MKNETYLSNHVHQTVTEFTGYQFSPKCEFGLLTVHSNGYMDFLNAP